MLLKIIGVGVCTLVINIILREYKSDFAILANVCGGLLIFLIMIDGIREIVQQFVYIKDFTGIKLDIITPIIKVIGVGYITEFTADLAEDSGNKSIANKVIMGGKIAICVLALPIIKSLINAIISLI